MKIHRYFDILLHTAQTLMYKICNEFTAYITYDIFFSDAHTTFAADRCTVKF